MPQASREMKPEILPLGADGLLVRFSTRLEDAANRAVLNFARALEADLPAGVAELSTALASLYLRFDPDVTNRAQLMAALKQRLDAQNWSRETETGPKRHWHIPCAFGGALGPQLAETAALLGMSESEAVADLVAHPVRVLAIGFAPGQPYLGMLPERWDLPRLPEITPKVPASALVVAVRQLIVFSNETPTGLAACRTDGVSAVSPGCHQALPASARRRAAFRACFGRNLRSHRARRQRRVRRRSAGDCGMNRLTVERAGPAMSVQDLGRSGTLRLGLSRGGAADRLALLEAAALLGQRQVSAAVEMAGTGGRFRVDTVTRIALTGAPMRTTLDGAPLAWNATHLIRPGARLEIGPAERGVYGYLTLAGGLTTAEILGSRSAHLVAGLGRRLCDDDTLPFGPDPRPDDAAMHLQPDDRFSGGEVRIIETPQTSLYSRATRQNFEETRFRRSTHGNRQGVRLDHDGAPFVAEGQLGIVSDVIVPGDIQMTGDGIPFVLLPECQTIGGYPRIAAVIPADLPKVAQAAPGAELRFTFIALDEADRLLQGEAAQLRALRQTVRRRLRDLHDIPDLLSYQLISGAIADDDMEGP